MLQSWLTPDPRSLLTLPLALLLIPVLSTLLALRTALAAALGRPASRTEGEEGVLLVVGEAVVM